MQEFHDACVNKMYRLFCFLPPPPGKQLHVYSKLPFISAVGAMAYHPSEHLLVLSAFGTCQPIIALNHIPTSVTTANLPNVPAGTRISTSAGVETRNSDHAVTKAQFRVSQKWNDLAKTMERISDSITVSRLT